MSGWNEAIQKMNADINERDARERADAIESGIVAGASSEDKALAIAVQEAGGITKLGNHDLVNALARASFAHAREQSDPFSMLLRKSRGAITIELMNRLNASK